MDTSPMPDLRSRMTEPVNVFEALTNSRARILRQPSACRHVIGVAGLAFPEQRLEIRVVAHSA